MNLDKLSEQLHETAVEKGFWDAAYRMEEQDFFIFVCKQLAMVHSAVTEVLEAIRKDKGQDQVVEELSDITIRLCDLYGGLREFGYVSDSLNRTVRKKARINKGRERLHGVRG